MTFFEDYRDYRRYCGIVDGDAGRPAYVFADVIDDLDFIFTQVVIGEEEGVFHYG